MAMTAPRTQAQTERRKPAAAMTRGKVMKGPTPIISSMLKRTAERRPMRRSRCAEGEEMGIIGRLVISLWGGAAAWLPGRKKTSPFDKLSRKSRLEFGRPSGAEAVAGLRSQGSRPLARTSPWAILERSYGAQG